MKNSRWILLFLLLCAVCALSMAVLNRKTSGSVTAVIKQDGTVIREINLSELKEPMEFEIEDGCGGHNTVHAEHGRIAVTKADCPDKICVKQGYIEKSGVPIVCLPHKLSVAIVKNDAIDAVSGGK